MHPRPDSVGDPRYLDQLNAEGRKWGGHLAVEAAKEMNAWLDHPAIGGHFFLRSRLEGLSWYEWVPRHLGGPANRSLELGCGSGRLSKRLYTAGATREVEGMDASVERIEEAEKARASERPDGSSSATSTSSIFHPIRTTSSSPRTASTTSSSSRG